MSGDAEAMKPLLAAVAGGRALAAAEATAPADADGTPPFAFLTRSFAASTTRAQLLVL